MTWQGASLLLCFLAFSCGQDGSRSGSHDFGTWGDWGQPSACSRTCGGGVMHRTRKCHHGIPGLSRGCQGEDITYESCNTQPCPSGLESFRSVQCSRFNSALSTWLPHDTEESRQCALVCQEQQSGRVQQLQDRVVDGTECETAQGLGICLAGACKAVGCDRRLESRTKEDACLVCGGQGDSCQTYSGTLTDKAMTEGLNSIATVPAGSTTITVRQVSSGQASLSLIGGNGVVYFDSRQLPLDESVVMVAGAKVSYRRSVLAGGAKSVVVSARGPTNTTLHIKVNYTSHQTGVEYEYSVPKARVLESNPNQPFTWIFGAWTKCSHECGDGYQLRAVSCIDRRSGASVDDSKCGVDSKPEIRQPCNIKPCGTASNLYRWLPGHWGKCSVECGVGEQVQEMYCVESGPGGDTVYVREELCQRYSDKPPVYKRACEGEGEHCPYWATYDWTQCSVTCGYGIQTRRVLCQRDPEDPEGEPETVEESLCTEERPETHMVCQLPACADGSNAHGMVQVEDRDDDCENSVYKCCPDGVTAATGPNLAGCPTSAPATTNVCLLEPERGRCWDFSIKWNFVPQEGECRRFWYGGCEGNGNRFDTEDECLAKCGPQGGQVVKAKDDCTARTYGCCPDGVTAARGPNYLGCPSTRPVDSSCQRSRFGCCPDGVTPATGPQQRGCDDGSEDDEDNRTPGSQDSSGDCRRTRYGCCQDGVTAARGPHKEGCGTAAAASTSSGSSSNGSSSSSNTGLVEAQKRRACEQSYYGCCPGTDMAATGPNHEGCVSGDEFHPEVCSIPAERGSCSDYSVKWYYNSTFSRCDRFWYGGCGGNGNKFDTEAACRAGCVDLAGPAVCHLAAETGPCRAGHRRFFYNHKVGSCEQFIYGGCRGNANRFLTMEDCGRRCAGTGIAPSSPSRDTATAQTRPSGERLVPSHQVESCRNTQYGCCEDGITAAGGPNMQDCEDEGSGHDGDCGVTRYGCCPDGVTAAAGPSQRGCPSSVSQTTTRPTPKSTSTTTTSTPDTSGDRCSKSADRGPCSNYVVRWFHNVTRKECAQFWYGGCQGNDNRFVTRDECEAECTATEAPVTEDPDFVSICDMPVETGSCRSRIPRWHYSPLDRQCRLFYYTGCHGNENNFQTLPECQQTCMGIVPKEPPLVITTTTTTPAPHTFLPPPVKSKLTIDGSDSVLEGEELRLTCRAEGPTTPTDIQWFVNGQPVRSAPGSAAVTLRAVPSQHALVSELLIPRARGEHAAMYYCRSVPFVDVQRKNVVVRTEITHRLTTKSPVVETLLEDKTASNPEEVCRQPQAVGSCRGYFRRWYYDASLQQCREFVYSGCGGNSNSFDSQKTCADFCRPKDLVSSRTTAEGVCNQPALVGNCRGNFPRWYYDAGTRTCRPFVYSGCGANDNNFMSERDCLSYCRREETGTRVVVISTEPSVVCQQPVKAGNCGQRISRYYYNAEKGKCLPFEYGGCDGNSNNFESELACNQYCRSEDICNLPQAVGSCRGSFTRYYHDPASRTCKQFVYGGCHGNPNNFGTLEACQSKCLAGSGREVVSAKTKEACYLRPERGRCVGSYLQWYHDPQSRRCQRFVYSGCEGNANRFATEEECEQLCAPRVDVVFTPAPPQPGADVCALAMDRGSLCGSWTVVWYYNASRGLCIRYYYGGCGGNGNRFSSEEECQARCVLRTERPTTITTPAPPRHRCENSRYGCCPDRVTVSIDASHSNCRDDRVVVGPGSEGDVREVLVNRGATALIHCYKPGSAISWYKEGFYLTSDNRFTIFNNGTLAIRDVDDDVAEQYVCRVSDGNNIPQNYRYIVHIKVPLSILPGPPIVTVGPGENAYFHCQASGYPTPTVQWTFQGLPVRSGGRYTAYYNGSLAVSGVSPREAGDYKCTAHNGVDTPLSRTTTLRLARELKAVVRIHGNGTFYEGETGRLSCTVSGYPTPTLSWHKDGRPLGAESSDSVYMEGDDLVLRQMSVEDSGLYECVAKNSLATAKDNTYIQVRPPALQESCVDKHPRCKAIVEANLCGHTYFWKQCCKSCQTKRDRFGKPMSPSTRG